MRWTTLKAFSKHPNTNYCTKHILNNDKTGKPTNNFKWPTQGKNCGPVKLGGNLKGFHFTSARIIQETRNLSNYTKARHETKNYFCARNCLFGPKLVPGIRILGVWNRFHHSWPAFIVREDLPFSVRP